MSFDLLIVFLRFLPKLAKQILDQTLEHIGITSKSQDLDLELSTSCSVKDGVLRIGNTQCNITETKNVMKVPDTLFYDNPMVREIFLLNSLSFKGLNSAVKFFFPK